MLYNINITYRFNDSTMINPVFLCFHVFKGWCHLIKMIVKWVRSSGYFPKPKLFEQPTFTGTNSQEPSSHETSIIATPTFHLWSELSSPPLNQVPVCETHIAELQVVFAGRVRGKFQYQGFHEWNIKVVHWFTSWHLEPLPIAILMNIH